MADRGNSGAAERGVKDLERFLDFNLADDETALLRLYRAWPATVPARKARVTKTRE